MTGFDRCANCNKSESELPEPLLLCRPCQSVHYCNKACQQAHWEAHVCKCFGEWGPFVPKKPYSSYPLPDLIPSARHPVAEEPLLFGSPLALPYMPIVPDHYAEQCSICSSYDCGLLTGLTLSVPLTIYFRTAFHCRVQASL